MHFSVHWMVWYLITLHHFKFETRNIRSLHNFRRFFFVWTLLSTMAIGNGPQETNVSINLFNESTDLCFYRILCFMLYAFSWMNWNRNRAELNWTEQLFSECEYKCDMLDRSEINYISDLISHDFHRTIG